MREGVSAGPADGQGLRAGWARSGARVSPWAKARAGVGCGCFPKHKRGAVTPGGIIYPAGW